MSCTLSNETSHRTRVQTTHSTVIMSLNARESIQIESVAPIQDVNVRRRRRFRHDRPRRRRGCAEHHRRLGRRRYHLFENRSLFGQQIALLGVEDLFGFFLQGRLVHRRDRFANGMSHLFPRGVVGDFKVRPGFAVALDEPRRPVVLLSDFVDNGVQHGRLVELGPGRLVFRYVRLDDVPEPLISRLVIRACYLDVFVMMNRIMPVSVVSAEREKSNGRSSDKEVRRTHS